MSTFLFRKIAQVAKGTPIETGGDAELPTGVRAQFPVPTWSSMTADAGKLMAGTHPAQIMIGRTKGMVPKRDSLLATMSGEKLGPMASNWFGLADQTNADTFSQDSLKSMISQLGGKAVDPGIARNYVEALKRGHSGTVLGTAGAVGLGAYGLYKLLSRKKKEQPVSGG